MRKSYFLHWIILGLVLIMSSCSENDDLNTSKPGDGILFSASRPQTRTIYDGWLQLDWITGDQIGIYSAEANALDVDIDKPKHSIYEITGFSNESNHSNHAEFNVLESEQGLKWGSYNDHTFYGAYPAERIETYPDEGDMKGMFKMKYKTNQVCRVSSTASPYETTPDMKNAYMVAKNTLAPTSDNCVLLNFRPIMTTLGITVKAGATGENIGTGIIPAPTTITGVSVIMPKALSEGKFIYDVDNDGLKNGSVMDNTKEAVFVSFEQNDERYIKLNKGENISFLAFLPPISMDGTANNAAKIRIHTTGYQNYVISLNGNLAQESKIKVELPDFDPNNLRSNNWMTYLDDKVYVSQLSIPGAYKDFQSSSLNLRNLMNMGVRAVDLRSVTDVNSVIENMKLFLGDTNNKGEFIIALCSDNTTIQPDNIVKDFDANMTLGQARGKILVIRPSISSITFNDYTDTEKVISSLKFAGNKEPGNWTVTYCAKDGMEVANIASSNKSIYEHIVKTQEGNTGIVMTPYACSQYYDASNAVYGDLLTQSIIDCNYKFIHKFSVNN